MWKDKLFWFAQPSIILNSYDNYFLWLFVSCIILGVIFKIFRRFSRHGIFVKLLGKLGGAFFWMGISGLIWYGLRFENTPIFSNRYWAGITLIILVIWLAFILKYLFTDFRREKREYDRQQLNSRYIPGQK